MGGSEPVCFVRPMGFSQIETARSVVFNGTVRAKETEMRTSLGQRGRLIFGDGAINEGLDGMANMADGGAIIVLRRDQGQSGASGFGQTRTQFPIRNMCR